MSISLVSLLRTRYLECVQSVQPASRWKILVLDPHTQAHIGSVLKMYDILEQGVQRMPIFLALFRIELSSRCGVEVELITNQRAASPKLEAVYILEPTAANVSRIIRDFEPARSLQGKLDQVT